MKSNLEFDIIQRYFCRQSLRRSDVTLGIGDDAAVTQVPNGKQLVIATDTLISGVHFFPDAAAKDIGHKALAVNLSDLAAMGAEPAWATLAITLPAVESEWLQDFSEGFFELADTYQMQLIGGDVTQGPLAITVQVMGFVAGDKLLCRDVAQAGDRIYVTGELGAAALALDHLSGEIKLNDTIAAAVLPRLHRPKPKVAEGLCLASIANAAIDISDGLLADLGHILHASQVGAMLHLEEIPVAAPLLNIMDYQQALQYALRRGDDYELCFTVAPNHVDEIQQLSKKLACPMTAIGVITDTPGMYGQYQGHSSELTCEGYHHF